MITCIVKDSKKDRKYNIYNNGQKDIRVYEGDLVPDGFTKGSCRSGENRIPWNKGLDKSDPRVALNAEHCQATRRQHGPYTAWNKGLTQETDERVALNHQHTVETLKSKYNVDNAGKLRQGPAWNKGLTKETDSRMKKASDNHKGVTAWNKGLTGLPGHPRSEETKQKISQTHMQSECQQRRFRSMQRNGTLGHNQDTVAEKRVYQDLLTRYDAEDIKHPYMDGRYPFRCDFYIQSEDKFIEVHGNWTHGGRPYDPEDLDCQAQLAKWQEKAKTSAYYRNAIYTWTDLDVRKAETAKRNHLNFEVIY